MSYPDAVEIAGVEYKLNTDYTVALACFRCIGDPDISEVERAYGVIGLLYADPPHDEHLNEALSLAVKFLQVGNDREPRYRRPDMDFDADEMYIKASFLSDYKIDLDDAGMHWWKFCTLLQGLTDDCILNRVRDLRNYDLSTVKDAKSRQKITQAQRDVALPTRMSEEEQSIADDFFSQLAE